MDCSKVGSLILAMRKERGMTQKQLADLMYISDRTISKWERGQGCPDVSLLGELSGILGINIEKILEGDLQPNSADGGNMKRIKFYTCPTCGNIMTATGEAEIACCGRKLSPLVAKPSEGKHSLNIETVEDEHYITSPHEMTKEHYLNFIAQVGYDRVTLIRLYPEQNLEVRVPRHTRGKLFFCCNNHGLYEVK